ncbi:hypothetical protein L6R52_35080, partial [Myxococcota bacterium]|nr:hypothetical protein [Myxococcota bacterium]
AVDDVFARAIPSYADLRVVPARAAASPSRVLALVDAGLRAAFDRLEWLLGSPADLTDPAGDWGGVLAADTRCATWTGRDPRSAWRLTSCLVDAEAGRYAFRVEAEPIDEAEPAPDVPRFLVAAGESTVAGPLEGLAGRIGFDLGGLSAVEGRALAGRIEVGFRVEPSARRLVLALRHYRPTRADATLSDGTVSDGTVSDGTVSDGTGSSGGALDGLWRIDVVGEVWDVERVAAIAPGTTGPDAPLPSPALPVPAP